jgi:hypothetical protein
MMMKVVIQETSSKEAYVVDVSKDASVLELIHAAAGIHADLDVTSVVVEFPGMLSIDSEANMGS